MTSKNKSAVKKSTPIIIILGVLLGLSIIFNIVQAGIMSSNELYSNNEISSKDAQITQMGSEIADLEDTLEEYKNKEPEVVVKEKIVEKEIIKYVCQDGVAVVDSVSDCPTEAEILENTDYEFITVNKAIVKSSSFWNNDIKVTLLKVGTKTYNEKMRVRVYWKLENPGTKAVSVHPHQHTIILDGKGGQYESTLLSREKESDDFMIGGDTGGDLRPGVIAQGGVNVDNVPADSKNLDIILDLTGYDNIEFDVRLD